MGCCLSSTDKSSPPKQHQHFKRSDDSRAPPPVDKETVKEVLSETPTPKPKLRQEELVFEGQKTTTTQDSVFEVKLDRVPQQKTATQQDSVSEVKLDRVPQQKTATQQDSVFEVKLDRVHEQKMVFLQDPVFAAEEKKKRWQEEEVPSYGGGEISEVASEISESISATTVTRDEDDEVIQQRIALNRVSPRKLRKSPREGFGPGRVVGNSPTRRTDSSPVRRYSPNGNGVGSTRSGQQPGGGRRVGLRTETNRRDPGESSGRRSRSPVTRVTDNGGVNKGNMGRSPSANRRYPGRSPVENSNSSTRRIAEEPKMEGNESLENPLVSLECFIFL